MENANYRDENQINDCLGMGWWGRMDYKRIQELLLVIEVHYLDCGDGFMGVIRLLISNTIVYCVLTISQQTSKAVKKST